jgi:hypothetical protein
MSVSDWQYAVKPSEKWRKLLAECKATVPAGHSYEQVAAMIWHARGFDLALIDSFDKE